jgi:polar amino acid transport system substrate-binding protein
MAAEIAKRLGVPVTYVKFERPSHLADAGGTNVWDIGLIGAEPARAQKITFTPAYCEIEATYLVQPNSLFKTVADVDQKGSRIAVRRGAAYDLWLERNIKHATVVRSDSAEGPLNQFIAERLEALAGLRQALLTDVKKVPGAKILPGNFTTVQQAIGTAKPNTAGAAFLGDFVAEVKRSGFVAQLIEKHHVVGLSVAP